MYTAKYDSPVGELLLASDGDALIGLWLAGQKFYAKGLEETAAVKDSVPIFCLTKHWLDDYFAGRNPDPSAIPLAPRGSEFRRRIWRLLMEIPYGEMTTYGQLAKCYEARFGQKTSARAVGGAVGQNPLSILIPCHRVIGADGSITGYAGGVENKQYLLQLERK